jgi:hypothetical protein
LLPSLVLLTFSAVALIRAVAVVPAVDGAFAVASFPADPGVSKLL